MTDSEKDRLDYYVVLARGGLNHARNDGLTIRVRNDTISSSIPVLHILQHISHRFALFAEPSHQNAHVGSHAKVFYSHIQISLRTFGISEFCSRRDAHFK